MLRLSAELKGRIRQHCREQDKRQHFFYSLILVLLIGLLFSPLVTLLAVALIGLGKEIWDHYYGSGFCWIDMIANGIGIFSGLVILPLFH